MGTTTTNYNLYKPDEGETGWATLVNASYDTTDSVMKANEDSSALNTTHRTSDGSDHTFIDQDVTSGSSPTFTGTNITGITAAGVSILDSGAFYTATDVEGAFAENRPLINANTAKVSNVSTALSTGTVTATTYGITSDGGADDVVLVEADTTNAGLLGSDKWDEIVANTAKTTNANHSGDASGDTALTAQPAIITGKGAATVAGGDLVLVSDIDDSNNLKQVTASSIGALAGPGATTFVSLTDTPANFTSQALALYRVNAGETAVESVTPDYGIISAGDAATDVTGAELETLTDGSNADALHTHAGGGGATLTNDVNQTTHGFSVNDWIYHNGTIYAAADASAAATAESIGIVSAVAGVDDFTVQFGGRITGLTGLTAGEAHFLSETAGAITATAPSTSGAVVKPVLVADSTTTGYIFNMRGSEVDTAVSAPSTATYLTQTPDATLSAEQSLSTLSSGIMRVATTTGVVTSLTDSAGIAANISDETGTGSLVFASSPTLVTPALGTPSSLTGTNITGTAAGLTAGNVTTNANLTGDVTSVGNAATIPSATVTTAMRANGTDGEIPTWNASGVASNVATGTAGQILTSNGAGTAPTFQTAGSSGLTDYTVFTWSGSEVFNSNDYGTYTEASATPALTNAHTHIIAQDKSTYQNVLYFRFKKTSGIDAVTIEARCKMSTGTGQVQVNIGGQTNNISQTSTSYAWATPADVNVSSLSDGTTYDGIVRIKVSTADTMIIYLTAITLIGGA